MQYQIGQVLTYKDANLTMRILAVDGVSYWGKHSNGLYATYSAYELDKGGWYPIEEVKEIESIGLFPEGTVLRDMAMAKKLNEVINAINELRRKE